MSERELASGLTLRVVATIVVTTILSFITNFWLQTLTVWSAFPGLLPPPYFLVIIIVEILSRISSRFKLTPQEHTVLITAFLMMSGITYVQYGQQLWGISCVPTYSFFMPIYVLNKEEFSDWWKWIPSYWAPLDRDIIEKAWIGLRPGEEVNWGAWLVPTLYWTIFFLTWATFSYFLGFMMRKPMVEVERLPFPSILPTAYLVTWYTEEKGGLFDLTIDRNLIFWSGFALGFLSTLPDILRYFLPEIPPSTEWSTMEIKFGSVMQNILPGAYSHAFLMIPEIPMFVFCSIDILITIVLTYVIFGILYPGLGVAMGILEYEPGVEEIPLWGSGYYSQYGAFKFWYMFAWGVPLAIGLWFLYFHRSHFISFFKSLSGKDIVEQGVSYRFVAIGLLATTILLLAFFIGAGVPTIVALVIIVFYYLIEIANIRVSGDLWRHFTVYSQLATPIVWYTGVITGAWPDVTPTTSIAAFRSEFMQWALGNSGPRLSPFSARTSIVAYKLADMTKTRAKDILLTMILTAVVAGFAAHFIGLWWIHHLGGLSNIGPVPYYEWSVYGAQQFVLSEYGMNVGEIATLMVTGFILTLLIYVARTIYIGFPINPIAFMIAGFNLSWVWLNALIALIIKLLVVKIGGVKLYEEKVVPLMVGILLGYGVNYFIVALLQFTFKAVPSFYARYV